MSNGLDVAQQITATEAAAIIAGGHYFVGRYYGQNPNKILTPREAVMLKGTGLFTIVVYEDGPTDAGYFSAERGLADARRAIALAHECGQPAGTPIYFAVDYDASAADLGVILPYAVVFHNAVKASGFYAGAYGNGLVLRALLDAGYIHFAWLSESTGWADHAEFLASGDWNIHQLIETMRDGLDVDTDTANNGGGWKTTLV